MFRYLFLLLVPAFLSAQIIPDLYIVELTDSPRATPVTRRAAQDNLVRMMGARHQVKGRVRMVGNALVVESRSAEELSRMAGVRRVTPVVQLRTSLDRALTIHQIQQAWERLPQAGRAGEGIKIGIIDTGIDAKHPAFAGEAMTAPEGYPKVSNEAFLSATNGKVIVQRSYDSLNRTESSIVDGAGHGTAVAMVAAGARVKSQFGEISGAAPGAWVGAYRVFGGATGSQGSSAALLQALDDAVADGMDVVNISLGFFPPFREALDPMADAVKRAVEMGVMVIKAAGNEGPDIASVDSPTVAGVGISVGAIRNDRAFAEAVGIEGRGNLLAVASTGTRPEPLRGKLVDVTAADPTGLACGPIPGDSLRGAVALILRGSCFFSEKLKNAEAAGAIAAVVYTHAMDPLPFTMAVDDARLPALMVGFDAGRFLKSLLEEKPGTEVLLTFSPTVAFALRGTPLSTFSSRGPTIEGRISPDMVAVGQFLTTASGLAEPSGSVYNESGFLVAQGTSFAAPLVAGAYAVLKQARPGLSPRQYRSILLNSTAPAQAGGASEGTPQEVGAGKLDLLKALDNPLIAQPAVLSFGAGGPQGPGAQEVTIENTSSEGRRYVVRVEAGGGTGPAVEPAEFDLAAGGSTRVRVTWPGDLAAGAHYGRLVIGDANTEGDATVRIPYWYGIARPEAANITFLPYPPFEAEVGATVDLWFLTTDVIGLAATEQDPEVTVEEGGGSVVEVRRRESLAPGLVKATVRIGPERDTENVFLIRCGEAVARAYIVGL